MIRIALVEDEEKYVQEYKKYLKDLEIEMNEHFQIITFYDGDDIVEKYEGSLDIILMDIQMSFMDGMSAAKEIRMKDQEVVIIFITNMPQFVMDGYKVDALDYLLKPVNYYAFTQTIKRAVLRMNSRRVQHFITISIKGGMQKLDVLRIYYVEVDGHELIYHTRDGVYYSRGSMKNVEDQLSGYPFFRCNKCYLINLEYTERIQDYDVIVGGVPLQVSRSKRKELLDVLNDYLINVSK